MAESDTDQRLLDLLKTSCGPSFWKLLKDDDVTEVMANPDGRVWVERFGTGMGPAGHQMPETKRRQVINIVASSVDDVCNRHSPTLSAVLPDSGARFQGFVPPVVPAPSIIIRRRATAIFSLQDYIDDDIMAPGHAQFIYDAIRQRQNLLIAGGTGSGKTTLANAVLDAISDTDDRLLTIEDTPELQVSADNHIALYVEPDAGFTWQKAVKASLRTRPDRIVVGEVRDASAHDLLKAWNTGHNGGCCTLHANSAKKALTRMESLIEEAIPNAPVDLIAEAVDAIVFIEGTATGREVTAVERVVEHTGTGYVFEPVHPDDYRSSSA
jgi:type IV secretion system protein VirB11